MRRGDPPHATRPVPQSPFVHSPSPARAGWRARGWGGVGLPACSPRVQLLFQIGTRFEAPGMKPLQARTVDLDLATLTQLQRHRERQADERRAWGPGYQDSDLVFLEREWRPRPPGPVQPGVRGRGPTIRAPPNPPARFKAFPRHYRPTRRSSRQGDQRASWARTPGVHYEAVRPRHPGNAGRSGSPL